MSKIFDDLQRLEEMQARLDQQFERAAKYPTEKAAQVAAGYAAVTQAIHSLKETDTYFAATIEQLENEGTPEARMQAARMSMDRAQSRPKCRGARGRRRSFE